MIGRVELREERLGVHVRNLIEQNQGTQIGAIDAGVIADRRRTAGVERVAVPEVYFETRVVDEVRVANRTRVFIALTQASPARATLTLLPVGLLAI